MFSRYLYEIACCKGGTGKRMKKTSKLYIWSGSCKYKELCYNFHNALHVVQILTHSLPTKTSLSGNLEVKSSGNLEVKSIYQMHIAHRTINLNRPQPLLHTVRQVIPAERTKYRVLGSHYQDVPNWATLTDMPNGWMNEWMKGRQNEWMPKSSKQSSNNRNRHKCNRQGRAYQMHWVFLLQTMKSCHWEDHS